MENLDLGNIEVLQRIQKSASEYAKATTSKELTMAYSGLGWTAGFIAAFLASQDLGRKLEEEKERKLVVERQLIVTRAELDVLKEKCEDDSGPDTETS